MTMIEAILEILLYAGVAGMGLLGVLSLCALLSDANDRRRM
jgi:hypothetical protein